MSIARNYITVGLFLGAFCGISSAQTEHLAGDYRTELGQNISILDVELGFAFFHFGTGRFGILHKDSVRSHTWYAGPGAVGASPREIEIKFLVGSQPGLQYKDLQKSSVLRAIKMPPYRKEEVEISHGKVRLKATLSFPPGEGPYPAVVMVHGGGPGPRSALEIWSNMYNRLGVACLTYDKRGSGETVGPNWNTFKDLADDALSCVDFLANHGEIRKSKIGMAAFSQGGWVSAIASPRNGNISFMIMISCPAVSASDRDRESALLRLKVDGFPEEALEEAREFGRTYDAYGRGEISWTAYKKLLDASRNKAWFSYIEFTNTPVDSNTFYSSPYGRYYDPATDLSSLRIPVLALYGQNDTTVPQVTNSQEALANLHSSDPLTMVLVLPAANHSLTESKTGSDKELINLNTYVKGYFELIGLWLNRVLAK